MVRPFCFSNNDTMAIKIHKTSKITNKDLDHTITVGDSDENHDWIVIDEETAKGESIYLPKSSIPDLIKALQQYLN